jgi:hypothetical protein
MKCSYFDGVKSLFQNRENMRYFMDTPQGEDRFSMCYIGARKRDWSTLLAARGNDSKDTILESLSSEKTLSVLNASHSRAMFWLSGKEYFKQEFDELYLSRLLLQVSCYPKCTNQQDDSVRWRDYEKDVRGPLWLDPPQGWVEQLHDNHSFDLLSTLVDAHVGPGFFSLEGIENWKTSKSLLRLYMDDPKMLERFQVYVDQYFQAG